MVALPSLVTTPLPTEAGYPITRDSIWMHATSGRLTSIRPTGANMAGRSAGIKSTRSGTLPPIRTGTAVEIEDREPVSMADVGERASDLLQMLDRQLVELKALIAGGAAETELLVQIHSARDTLGRIAATVVGEGVSAALPRADAPDRHHKEMDAFLDLLPYLKL